MSEEQENKDKPIKRLKHFEDLIVDNINEFNENKQSFDRLQEVDDLSPKTDHILPLNSAVIQRIRLNISTSLPSNAKTEDSDDCGKSWPQSIGGSVLQNTMKEKLANVLQLEPQLSHQNIQNSNQSESPVIDVSILSEKWSTLDSDYQQLIQTVKKNPKNSNTICLNSDLWKRFDAKMKQFGQYFQQKRSVSQRTRLKKKIKNYH